jgi:septum formation topological specificity factor MinE
MIEMDKCRFCKSECIDVLSKYLQVDAKKVEAIIELGIKLGFISEYIFEDEK